MQVVSQILATARQDPADLEAVRTTVHIDNVRYTYLKSNNYRGMRMSRTFKENCEYVHATLCQLFVVNSLSLECTQHES